MNRDKITKYSILMGPMLLFLFLFWMLNGIFLISTERVRGVHLSNYATMEEDTPPLFAIKDTTQQPKAGKVAQLPKNK